MKALLGFAVLGSFILISCNKEFENITPGPAPEGPPTGSSLNDIINNDTSYSFLKAAVAKAGLGATLGNTSLRYTAFLPDNAAFRLSGIPSAAVLNAAFDTASTRGLVSYHIIPQLLTAEQIPTTFPNIQRPTLLNPAPQLSALLRLSTFPSRRTNGAWINNVFLKGTNILASNAVIHKTLTIVAPPSKSAYELITADTTLSFLVAAMTRADSGRTSTTDTSFTEIAKSIGANITLFAPVNNAFRAFLTANGLPASTVAFGFMPVQTVRAILAYHVLPVRAFSVNMPITATNIPAFGTPLIPGNPQLSVIASFTGPVATFTVKGVANGSASNVTTQDIHATNAALHKIDQVLRPL